LAYFAISSQRYKSQTNKYRIYIQVLLSSTFRLFVFRCWP